MKIESTFLPVHKRLDQRELKPFEQSQSGADIADTKDARDIERHKVSRELESVFLTNLFKAMEKTVPESGMTGSNNSLSSMMFSSVLGDAVAERGGIGIADMIYRSIRNKENIPSLEKLSSENGNPLNVESINLNHFNFNSNLSSDPEK